MTTKTERKSSKPKTNAAQQQRMQGDGFPEPLPKEVTVAVGSFLTTKREAAEASEAHGNARQKLIELAHKHKLERIPIEGENKFIEVNIKDTCLVKTKPKDQEDRRKTGESYKPEFERD